MKKLARFSLLFLIILVSCSFLPDGSQTAIIWTDRPEFAFYAEYFNAAQDQYKVEIYFHNFPAQELKDSGAGINLLNFIANNEETPQPDIIAGSWLKSDATRLVFKPLDRQFKRNVIRNSDFYPRLLTMGNIDGKQFLLPVSFNAPMVIFARGTGEHLSNLFTIGFDEMKTLGKGYNAMTRGAYTQMGFSPSWDANFLFITATLFNASFRASEPLSWNTGALDQAMQFAYDWACEANTSIQSVDDFIYKYFYTPPAKLVLSERILFTCMDSNNFFILAEEQQNNLDFRWLAENNTIPLVEDTVYLGMIKRGKAPKAAEAFLAWFFSMDTQRGILERSRQNRLFEISFGIGGGFSAMRPVTEQVFPQFYQGLLGHMPPGEFLSPANTLPGNWMALKERVIFPYLLDRSRQPDREGLYPLERRLSDWQRVNR